MPTKHTRRWCSRPWSHPCLFCTVGLHCRLCQAAQEDTPVNQLAWHDGMLFFNGAIRKTIPPNATAAGLDLVAQAVSI